MTGTPRTVTYLENTSFPLSGPVSGITPQQMQDFVATSAPNIAGITDPTNASGLGAPAIIRKTVYLDQVSGYTPGTGLGTTIQTANGIALQAAITQAASNGWIIEANSNTYEFYRSGGLIIPANLTTGFTWRGTRFSNIRNFYANSPTLVIGDATTPTNVCNNYDIDGFLITSGCTTNTISSTNANLLVIGAAAFSRFHNFQVSADYGSSSPSTPPYRCVLQSGGASGSGDFFSNSCEDWLIGGALQTLLEHQGTSTGNVWKNIYIHQGTPTSGPLNVTGPAVQFGNSISFPAGENDVFEQMNIEWVSTTNGNILNISNHRNLSLISTHLEGCALTQFAGGFISSSSSQINVDNLTVEVPAVLTGSGAGSFCAIFAAYGGCNYNVNNMRIEWSQYSFYGSTTVFVNETLPLFLVVGGEGDLNSSFTLNGLEVNDYSGGINTTFLQIDANMPRANFNMPTGALQSYRSGITKSVTVGAQFSASATYTHYGESEDAIIYVPAAITSFTLTLHTKQGPSTPASGFPTRTGNTLAVRRQSGSASGTLTVSDSTAGSITTNTTSATWLYFLFNGTAWVAAT